MTYQIRLPPTPSVIARDNTVVICYLDGSEVIWGEERSKSDALKIAKELEIELRAINYIKWHVRTFIIDLVKMLDSIGADENLLTSIIKDGHSFAFNDLSDCLPSTLKLDIKPELKELVIKKISQADIV